MNKLRALAAMALVLALTACGYHVTSLQKNAPLALPKDCRSLFLKSVENPTLNPEIDLTLRTEVRDEFTKHGGVTWAKREAATGYLHIKVISFTTSSSVTDENDNTLQSTASISMVAWVTRKSDGKEVWRCGTSHSETFTSDEESAKEDVIEVAARKLADRMREDY